MDLHVVGPLASPIERGAVDSVLGPRGEDGATSSGQSAREQRHLLLPVLHAIQDRVGHITAPALNYACRRLSVPPAEAYGVATFYALLATTPRPPRVAHVCDDIVCQRSGGEELCADLGRSLGPEGASALDGRVTWLRSPCLGRCEQAPAVLFTLAGETAERVSVAPIDAAGVIGRLDAASDGSGSAAGQIRKEAAADRLERVRRSVPQAGSPGLRLLVRAGVADPSSLDDYRTRGGYRALAAALALGPEAVIEEVTTSKLLGRGGAAFPTGRKWAAVRAARAAAGPGLTYVVCNADESEPGTFKDRVLLEEDPFAIVEATTIAGFAVGAERGFVYVRDEYPLAERRIAGAIANAREAGLLGVDLLGSGFNFELEVRRGAGAYVCGEETALFESIEGHRGEPRNKPPYPVERGLFGRPTAINNVETLANVLLVLGGEGDRAPDEGERAPDESDRAPDEGERASDEGAEHAPSAERAAPGGGERYASIGTPGSTGPKLFCLSGDVARPGLYEVELGATLGELIRLAGGVPGGRAIRAILLGGAAGTFVDPAQLDIPLTFEGTRAAGAGLGSGAVVVFDETVDLPATVRRIAQFFRDESCGQCVPCRVGTVRQEELLARLAAGSTTRSRDEELAILRELGQVMRDASICGLGQTASSAVESALRIEGPAPF